MAHVSMKIALAAALALSVAGCSKKKVEELPPPPPPAAPAPSPEAPPPPPESGPIPGSRADFVAQAGSDTIHFDTDSYDVSAEEQATLTRQAQWLAKYPNVTATIEGHCDERGTREYNLALGDRRANAAKNFLVNSGVAASRLSVIRFHRSVSLSESR